MNKPAVKRLVELAEEIELTVPRAMEEMGYRLIKIDKQKQDMLK